MDYIFFTKKFVVYGSGKGALCLLCSIEFIAGDSYPVKVPEGTWGFCSSCFVSVSFTSSYGMFLGRYFALICNFSDLLLNKS